MAAPHTSYLKLRDIKTDSPDSLKDAFDRVQSQVEKAFNGIYPASPILDGRIVAYLNGADDTGSGPTVEANRRAGAILLPQQQIVSVPHGLGRPYRGFIVVRQYSPNGPASVSEAYPFGAPDLVGDKDPAKTLQLTADITTTVVLWVF